MTETRHFITVDWCKKGRRGVFCDNTGATNSRDRPLTQEEMREELGHFWLILYPESIPLTAEELAEYTQWTPLAEYSNVWGIARRKS